MRRRVVITGIGVIAPNGVGKEAFWNACLNDKVAADSVPEAWQRFSTLNSSVWAPLPEVEYRNEELGRIEQKQLDTVSKNSIHATFEAIADAGYDLSLKDEKHRTFQVHGIVPERTGVFLGTGIGGIQTIGTSYAHQICDPLAKEVRRLKALLSKHDGELAKELAALEAGLLFPKRFNPFTVSMLMPNASAANIAIKLGLNGPNLTFPLACASGTAAIGHGFLAVSRADVDVAISGGTEFLYDAYGTIFRAFDTVKTLAHRNDEPHLANRPFDVSRSGFLFSQGGCGILVLEEMEHALKRGARPIAEILAYAETCDARSIMMMDPDATQIERMFKSLFAEIDTRPDHVDYINAHGTGTEQNDTIESQLIDHVFGEHVLINSTKALIGHTMGAAGAIEAAVTALSLKHQKIHGMPNLTSPLSDLRFVKKAQCAEIETAISESFAFGGHNTALLFKRI